MRVGVACSYSQDSLAAELICHVCRDFQFLLRYVIVAKITFAIMP